MDPANRAGYGDGVDAPSAEVDRRQKRNQNSKERNDETKGGREKKNDTTTKKGDVKPSNR